MSISEPERPASTRARPGWLASGAGLAGVVLGAAAVMLGRIESPATPAIAPVVTVPAVVPEPAAPQLVDAIARTRNTVVSLRTPTRAGAGVIIDASGVIITNMHVVGEVTSPGALSGPGELATPPQIRARFADGRELAARVVVADRQEDLAVLLLDGQPGERFEAATMGRSATLQPGTQVFAVGNPLGLSHSVSAGIVSAVDRVGVGGVGVPLVQLDASINVGNSGGPLFTLAGEVVGLVTARDRQAEGIAFALPIDHVRGFLQAVTGGDAPKAGALGVTLALDRPLPSSVRELGYASGLVVADVVDGGAAASAGVRADDVIVEARGARLDASMGANDPATLGRTFVETVRAMYPGERITLTVVRDGVAQRLEVETGAADDREQTFIDAERVLGVRLDRKREPPAIVDAVADRGLGRYGARLRGGEILGLLGRETADLAALGKLLGELRVLLRAGGRDSTAWVRIRSADGSEAYWPIELE